MADRRRMLLGKTATEQCIIVDSVNFLNSADLDGRVQTAVDPADDCTIWYVGDYLKQGAASYSTRIGAFRLPGCPGR